MSLSSQKRLRLSSEIRRIGIIADTPCDKCFIDGLDCYVMPDSNSRLKCSECVRVGRPCVNMSWESLDRTREEYQKKVDEDEKLLAEVISRLLRNKKILKQAEERARRKALCLASELEEAGELDSAESNCPAADALVAFSPTMWSTMDLIDSFSAPADIVQAAGGSS